jgi:hypothetical protein
MTDKGWVIRVVSLSGAFFFILSLVLTFQPHQAN